jgi:(p)ppGpp synthase/HD superfamily hydrolase
VFKANNGAGFVVMAKERATGGVMKIIVGIDGDGKIVATKTLSQNETAVSARRHAESKFQSQFTARTKAWRACPPFPGDHIVQLLHHDDQKRFIRIYRREGGLS